MRNLIERLDTKATIKWSTGLMVLAVLLLYISAAYTTFNNPYFWYDDAGQFWISKGLNHYSDPYSVSQGLAEVLENNKHYNLDPGGFSVLGHFWLMVSDNYMWVKLLPFLFFTAFLGCSYKLAYRVLKNRIFALIVVAWLLTRGAFIAEGGSFRAYSAEMCGVVVIAYLLLKYWNQMRSSQILKLSIVMCILCTLRYGLFLTSFGICIVLGLRIIFSSNTWKGKIVCLIFLGLPLLIMALTIYATMICYQNGGFSAVQYIPYLYANPKEYLGKMWVLYYILSICSLYIVSFKRSKICQSSVYQIIIIACAVTTIYFICSSLNLYPCDERHCVSCSVLLTLALLASIIRGIDRIIKYKLLLFTFASLAVSLYSFRVSYLSICSLSSLGTRMFVKPYAEFRRYLDANGDGQKLVFIAPYYVPAVRYMYEYGIWKEKVKTDNYPSGFILGNGEWHSLDSNERSLNKVDIINPFSVKCDFYLGEFPNESGEKHLLFQPVPGFNYIFTPLDNRK